MRSGQSLPGEENFGSIEAGEAAGIVATDADPPANIEALMKTVFVMKAGKMFKALRR